MLTFMVLMLGFRHGFDLDHIATIDAMTRSCKDNHRLASLVGFLFSLGHGLVVVLISAFIGSGQLQTIFPTWLDPLGQWISIFFLFAFGFITLWSLTKNIKAHSPPLGPKSLLFRSVFARKNSPILIVLIGSLFALSFDTVTQVALFSLSASTMAGWLFSLTMGIIFMLGMMMSDGLNGFFMSKIIQRADKKSFIVSQLIGWLIVIFSLSLGIIGLYEQLLEKP